MDSLTNQYRQIIKNVLEEYADFFGNDEQVKVELVLDEKNDRYLLVETGWKMVIGFMELYYILI
jgi:hypothetical protein